jgi:hypothetical protein
VKCILCKFPRIRTDNYTHAPTLSEPLELASKFSAYELMTKSPRVGPSSEESFWWGFCWLRGFWYLELAMFDRFVATSPFPRFEPIAKPTKYFSVEVNSRASSISRRRPRQCQGIAAEPSVLSSLCRRICSLRNLVTLETILLAKSREGYKLQSVHSKRNKFFFFCTTLYMTKTIN